MTRICVTRITDRANFDPGARPFYCTDRQTKAIARSVTIFGRDGAPVARLVFDPEQPIDGHLGDVVHAWLEIPEGVEYDLEDPLEVE